MNRAVGILLKLCLSLVFTAVLLIVIEVGSFFVRRVVSRLSQPMESVISESSVYKGQDWADKFWKDASIAFSFNSEKYWPFVVWKMAPYKGETIVIDANGLRRTLASHCDDPLAYTIWMFGGSTILGQGVPDWLTIPSQLASLYEKSGRPACVVNFGQLGWVNTQETIELALQLKKQARKPNLVVFYDGINDTGVALGSDQVDTHLNFEIIRRKFESDDQRTAGFRYLRESNTARLLIALGQRMAERRASEQPYAPPVDEATWKNRLEVAYLSNQGFVSLLAQKDHFSYVYFWQPMIYTGQKPLTAEEQSIVEKSKARYDPRGDTAKVYDFMRDQSRPYFFYIADIFSGVHETLYIDPWHVGPQGNSLVAERMFEILKQHGL